MKTMKLITGILQIIFSLFIFFQAAVVGTGNIIQNNHQTGGSGGVWVALFYLVAGISYIATRKNKKLTADFINFIFMALAWLIAISNAGSYSDLDVWGWIALIIGVVYLFLHIIQNHKVKKIHVER